MRRGDPEVETSSYTTVQTNLARLEYTPRTCHIKHSVGPKTVKTLGFT